MASSAAATDYDPFDDFDRAQGAGAVRDPYPIFHGMRAQAPILELDPALMRQAAEAGASDDGPQGPPMKNLMPEDSRVFAAMSWDAVSQVLRDGETFSSSGYAASMGVVMGRSILQMDEPEDSRYRLLIQRSFTLKALERWDRELIRPVVDRYIDRFADRGSADLVREFTFRFPVEVISRMMGLPAEDHDQFYRWVVELTSVGFDWERGVNASKALAGYLTPFIEERRRGDGVDLISTLAQSELDGQVLTTEEILAFLRLLGPAGAETTYRSSSNLLFGLLTNPDQLDALRRDRSLMDAAIDEGLRWEPPLTGIMRIATRDTEVCGVPVPSGAVIQVGLGGANRDPARWEKPDVFDIHRPRRQNMAFAMGPHRCLGLHLAMTETRAAIGTVLDRLPNLRLDPAAEDVHITGMGFRSPRSLPVLFDPA